MITQNDQTMSKVRVSNINISFFNCLLNPGLVTLKKQNHSKLITQDLFSDLNHLFQHFYRCLQYHYNSTYIKRKLTLPSTRKLKLFNKYEVISALLRILA